LTETEKEGGDVRSPLLPISTTLRNTGGGGKSNLEEIVGGEEGERRSRGKHTLNKTMSRGVRETGITIERENWVPSTAPPLRSNRELTRSSNIQHAGTEGTNKKRKHPDTQIEKKRTRKKGLQFQETEQGRHVKELSRKGDILPGRRSASAPMKSRRYTITV